jgi:hypothetical protein
VTAADSSSEMAMLPWVIEMIRGVVLASVMPNPGPVRMNVGRIGMSGLV